MSTKATRFFDGRSVVITGGSSGLGLALADALAARGAELTLVARDRARLTTAAEGIGASHPALSPRTIALDIGDVDAVRAGFAKIERVDILINCAGVLKEGYFESLPTMAFREVMEVNYFGALNVIRATLPQLRRAQGKIVNVASAAGLSGVFGYTAYCAAKHALIGFSDALRYELRPMGVMVQTVCPGEFDSPMVRALEHTRTPENRAHTLTIPKTRMSTIVRDTLRGVERGRPMIVPGAFTRGAVLATRLAPGLARAVGDRRVASVSPAHGHSYPADGPSATSNSTNRKADSDVD